MDTIQRGFFYFSIQDNLELMNDVSVIRSAYLVKPWYPSRHLLVMETAGKEHEALTELITQLALRGPFNLIAGDEWLPDRDTLHRSVRRHTLKVEETLNRPSLLRPMTCLQLLDLLTETDLQNRPTLILDFLHHFHNSDVDLALRDRTLEQCCQNVKRLSFFNSVVVRVLRRHTEEYRRFFPILASVADEIIPMAEDATTEDIQCLLF